MVKKDFEDFLIDIGGLERTYKENKGFITEANWFEINEGWYEIVKNCIDELLQLGWNKRVVQVKEKFGGLRFYIDTEDVPVGGYEVIEKYEKLSRSTCEKCGEAGVLRQGRWIRTLCDEHSEDLEPFNPESAKNLFG